MNYPRDDDSGVDRHNMTSPNDYNLMDVEGQVVDVSKELDTK